MKRILAIVLASVMVLACAAVLSVTAEATNVAPNATYTLHEQFRMGGADVGWGWDENAPISYPDESGKDLIDGVHAEGPDYGDAAWVGLNQSHPDFKLTAKPLYVDFKLAEKTAVGVIKVYLSNLCNAGISAPAAVVAQYSDDGVNYSGDVRGAYEEELVDNTMVVNDIALNAETQYIRLNFYSQAAANNEEAPDWLKELATPGKSDSWTFIDEVEIFDGGETTVTVTETIDVDGELNDTGWAPDGWIHVSTEEGTGAIQGSPEGKEDQPFSVQMRTDDEWLYVGVKYEQPMNKGTAASASGGRLRVWFHVDDEYDRYTHFYDLWPDENGDPVIAAKYNTKKDANDGALIEGSSAKGAISEKDGQTYFEFAVKYGEFLLEGQDTIRFFVNMHNGLTPTNTAMFHPGIPFETGDPFMPWTKWDSEHEGKLKIADAKLGEITVQKDEPEAYMWLKADDKFVPSVGYSVPADVIGTDPITIKAKVFFGEDYGGTGPVYLNVYPYNGENLLNWKDYADCRQLELGKWLDVELVDHNPASGETLPDKYNFGIGFYQATGSIKVASISVSSAGKEVWSVVFDDEASLEGSTNNLGEDTKDVYWGFQKKSAPVNPQPDDTYEKDIAEKVGPQSDNPHFDIFFDAETSDDRNSTVTITLKNFKAEDKISSILFPIFFDDERLEPDFKINDDNSVNCFGNLPGEKWENMTVYNPADDTSDVNNFPGQAHVYVQILNAEKEDQVCGADTEITITLNFKVKEGYEEGGIWVPTENIEATSWDDPAGQNILGATGGCTFAEIPEDQPSNPTPPVDDPTRPGDAGILVFAILGVLAVIGAAVVVKVRK